MHIVVLGATGFIGRHICARLLRDGHRVLAAVRDPRSAERRFPGIASVSVDLNRMTAATDWTPLLTEADAVVNAAGVLQSGRGQSAAAIHDATPRALFDACAAVGVRRVIQISAVSADPAAGTEYAQTKARADAYLRGLELDWVVLRPSLVYAEGSYGGTSAIRGLAGFPWITPLPGGGRHQFQPIHADDLAETVARCLTDPTLARITLDPCGPDRLDLAKIVHLTRRWLDLPPAHPVAVPMGLVQAAARTGDLLGAGPLRSTALRQMEYGNTADPERFAAAIGFRPRSMAAAMAAAPSHVQDRWHARLWSVRPLLTLSLGLLWIGSGLLGLVNPPDWSGPAALSVPFCLLDLVLGLAVLTGRGGQRLGLVQLAVVAGYTLGLSAIRPALWADPLGSLLKNLPILAAIAAWTAMQEER